MHNPQVIAAVKQLITWALIVVGWVIVHYLSLTRERQKEVRELKSKLVERILDIERRAIIFHQASNHCFDETRSLISEIDRVASAIARQPMSLLSIQPKLVRQFRSGITLRNFDASGFQPQMATSRLLADISLRTDGLIDALEQAYARRYLDRWWQAFRV